MKIGDSLVYLDMIEYLEETLPNFKQERIEVKRLASAVLWASQRHYTEEGAIVLSRTFIEKTLKSNYDTFKKMNGLFGFFEVGENYRKGVAKTMWPNAIVNELIVGFCVSRQDSVIRMVHDSHRNHIKLSKINTPTDLVLGDLKLPFGVRVDRVKLLEYLDDIEYEYSVATEPKVINKLEHSRGLALKFLKLCSNKVFDTNIVPQAYKIADSGRIYGTGVSIQNAPKDLRRALMNGSYDYDFENCHVSILAQQGDESLFPTLWEYMTGTKHFRNNIAITIGMSLDDDKIKLVKTCLLAITYGAGFRKSDNNPIFSDEMSNYKDRFINNPDVKAFKREIKAAGMLILGIEHTDRYFSRDMANKVQGVEAEMLRAVSDSEVVEVLVFDGWIGGKVNCISALEKKIESETGYTVKIKEELLQY